jgi:cytochrome d ubiquinol oxidase subunit II
MTTLQVIWFLLLGALLTVYAVLDGFDLGVGIFYPLVRQERERRILLSAIGPVWDGNEVWLITGGAVLFAAFPPVYATVFSGFYPAIMLVVFALVLRAVSFEFRSKTESAAWRRGWDAAFSAGSILPALLFPVALGNILRGLPLDGGGNYTGGFLALLSPYALLVGLTGFSMFATHGAIYAALKTDGDLKERAMRRAWAAWGAWAALFVASGFATIFGVPRRLDNFGAHPGAWGIVLFAVAALAMTGHLIRSRRAREAFVASAASIAGLMGIVGASLFPALVPPAGDAPGGLTIANASSSGLTLGTMLAVTAAGMPFVVGYTIWIYRTFKGKVEDVHITY